jgi:hypothetical protein
VEVPEGYQVVPAPVDIVVVEIPEGYVAGAFYTKVDDGYKVIEAPDGAIIKNLPEGGEEEEIGGQTYVVYNGVYFQPFTQNGEDVYQVVQMETVE